MALPKIGIDIDDVLCTTGIWTREVMVSQGLSAPHYENWNSFHLYLIPGFPIVDRKILWDFYKRELSDRASLEILRVVPWSQEALKTLSKHFEIHAITARSIETKKMTTQWMHHHFEGVFSTIDFLGERIDAGTVSKGDICKELGVVAMIDDNIDYALSVAEKSIPCALIPRPWNLSRSETHPHLHRVDSWDEALPWFLSYVWKSS